MAKLKLKITKSSITPKNLKAGEHEFTSASVGKWNLPKTSTQAAMIMHYLQLNCPSGLPIRLPSVSIGFATIGSKTISELCGDDNIIHPDSELVGILKVVEVDNRKQLSFLNITAPQLIGA